MATEQGIIHNLTQELLVMKSLILDTPEQHAIGHDLAVINAHSEAVSFYFTVQAAESNLLQEVNLLGAGREGLYTADRIYSDASFLQSQYNYWLT